MSVGIEAQDHDRIGQIFPWVGFACSAEKEDIDSASVFPDESGSFLEITFPGDAQTLEEREFAVFEVESIGEGRLGKDEPKEYATESDEEEAHSKPEGWPMAQRTPRRCGDRRQR